MAAAPYSQPRHLQVQMPRLVPYITINTAQNELLEEILKYRCSFSGNFKFSIHRTFFTEKFIIETRSPTSIFQVKAKLFPQNYRSGKIFNVHFTRRLASLVIFLQK